MNIDNDFMGRIRKGSLTYYMLLAMEKSVEASFSIADFVDNPGKFAWTMYRTDAHRSAFYQSIKQLREQGFIETHKHGKKIMLRLTDKGRQEAILKKLLEDDGWDNKWRIVIFDIPETHRRVRNILRGKLREWQFEQLQKSVWVSKKDCVKELRKFLGEVDIRDWVRVFVAEDKS